MTRSIRRASVLWIAADPVFGGSQSQVQFPAELAPFFGLSSLAEIGDHTVRSVIVAGIAYEAKKMDFHHNSVWRLNLPTARQGLGGYRGQILVFERTSRADQLRMWAVAPRSPVARLLARRSRGRGRVGSKVRDDGSRRRFGYF